MTKDVINFTVPALKIMENVLLFASVLIAKTIKYISIVKKHFKYTITCLEKNSKYALISKNKKLTMKKAKKFIVFLLKIIKTRIRSIKLPNRQLQTHL